MSDYRIHCAAYTCLSLAWSIREDKVISGEEPTWPPSTKLPSADSEMGADLCQHAAMMLLGLPRAGAEAERQVSDAPYPLPSADERRRWLKCFEEKHFANDPPLELILFDVDQIQGYLLESSRLPEIRGASCLVAALEHDDRSERLGKGLQDFGLSGYLSLPEVAAPLPSLPLQCIIYSAGGTALFLVPSGRPARVLKMALERHMPTRLEAASATVVSYAFPLASFVGRSTHLQRELRVPSNWSERLLMVDRSRKAPANVEDFTGFGRMVARLQAIARREKDSSDFKAIHETSALAERCGCCHRRPVATRTGGDNPIPCCIPCAIKREFGEVGYEGRDKGRTGKKGLVLCFEHWLVKKLQGGGSAAAEARKYLSRSHDANGGPPSVSEVGVPVDREDRAVSRLAKVGVPVDLEDSAVSRLAKVGVPVDLEDIARASRLTDKRNAYGIVNVDGNSLGDFLRGEEDAAAYARHSTAIKELFRNATYTALAEHLPGIQSRFRPQRGGPRYHYHPFEPLLMGGDDLLLFTPADVAIPIALSICKYIEKSNSYTDFRKDVTASGAALVVPVSTPVELARRMVDGLLKNAKKAHRTYKIENDALRSFVDFEVVTGDPSAFEPLEERRRRLYGVESGGRSGLVDRPCSLEALEKMLDLARDLRKKPFPATQLHIFLEAILEEDMASAIQLFRYQRARAPKRLATLYDRLEDYVAPGLGEQDSKYWPYMLGTMPTMRQPRFVDLMDIRSVTSKTRKKRFGPPSGVAREQHA